MRLLSFSRIAISLFACSFFLFLKLGKTAQQKSVVTTLDAKWSQTSLIAETSEFIWTEGNQIFWDFINNVIVNSRPEELNLFGDQQVYDFSLKQAAKLISPARMDLLKLALSLRTHSPAVELHRQIALQYDEDIHSCPVFVDVHGDLTCDLKKFQSLIDIAEKAENLPPVQLYSTDHIFPVGKNAKIIVILYGQVGATSDWLDFHKIIANFAHKKQLKYVLRHHDNNSNNNNDNNNNNNDTIRVRLSGYGVELAIKSTEYKAQDDSKIAAKETDADLLVDEDEEEVEDLNGLNFRTLKRLHPDLKASLRQLKLHLLEADELKPLRVWEVQDLSVQAAQRVVNADNGNVIQTLIDVSQNFPLMARSLARQSVDVEFRKEIDTNQMLFLEELGISPGDSSLFINGLSIDLDTLDLFDLLNTLKSEERLSAGFFHMGFRREYMSILMDIPSDDRADSYALDIREAFPDFVNNLDSDRQYQRWGNSVKLMLQPYFPGMIRPIARNLFTLVFFVDPAKRQSLALLKMASSFFELEIPIRLGLVFVVNPDMTISGFEDTGVALLNLYNFVRDDKKASKALKILTQFFDDLHDRNKVTPEDVVEYFRQNYPDEDEQLVFGLTSDYDRGRQIGTSFMEKSGLDQAPKVLLNGVPLDDFGLTVDRFEEIVMNGIMKLTPKIQKAIEQDRLTDKHNVMNWLLDQSQVMPRLNKRILHAGKAPDSIHFDFTDVMEYKAPTLKDFALLTERKKCQFMLQTMRHLKRTDEPMTRPVTLWVVGDMETISGRTLYYNAIKHLKHSHKSRVGLVHNPTNPDLSVHDTVVTKLIQASLKLLSDKYCRQFVTKLLKDENVRILRQKTGLNNAIEELAVHGMDVQMLREALADFDRDFLQIHSRFSTRTLALEPGQMAIVANGLLIGPLSTGESFDSDDFSLLERYLIGKSAGIVAEYIDKWNVDKDDDKSSNMVMRICALLAKEQASNGNKRHLLTLKEEQHSVVSISAQDETTAAFDIVAVIDPLSKKAQKLAPLLNVLNRVINADMKLIMNPRHKLSEMPLKRFYRLVLEPELHFDSKGHLSEGPLARFQSLPPKQLLTLNVVGPDSWLIDSVLAVDDLDNIRMETVEGDVNAGFELEYLLLEGHCFDELSGAPPRGLQFTLGTDLSPQHVDTIVMANLGYFQLKASPGAWSLRLRQGRSTDIYDITTHTNTESPPNEPTVKVLLNSFTGKTIRISVAKKPGKMEENLLSDSSIGEQQEDEEQESIWKSLSGTFGGSSHGKYDTVNIFSLASGHLYERFMRIMMLSVMKNCKHPVKFWLLKNYLSPGFKKFLPYMAEKYGFNYELVQYKWPRWLHHQTEKQRVMWGYKILFLDVLFPLDVTKIIFVDADQVVRSDMMDLMNFDLSGAPYGFTPFCDSRTEMDGFRFWKRGYWASHLAGRRYHISALYVIDLKKFRQIAAGDRLRGQYQGLSSDQNSLSNLDQDLPNNMIHQVRIKSLPQEWLWCETWCNDDSKSAAKTIDLCNNPQTKEPKLESAMRIIDEWKNYDNEIKDLIIRYDYSTSTVVENDEKIDLKKTDIHQDL